MRRSELRSNGDNVPSSLARTNPRFPGRLLLSVQGNREGKHGGGTAGGTRGPHDDAALHAPESGGDGRRDPRLAVTPCLDLRSLRDGENGEGGGNGSPITTEERRNGGERHGRDHDEGRRGAHRGGAVFQSAAAGFRPALGRTEEDTDRDPRLAVTPCLDLRSRRDGENGEGGGNGPPITTKERRNGGERQERNRDEAERARIEGCRVPVRCCRLSAGARANRRRH